METSEISVPDVTEAMVTNWILTAVRELFCWDRLAIVSQRLLEPDQIAEVLDGRRDDAGFKGGYGCLGLSFPPDATLLAPSLLLVSEGQEEQSADQDAGGEVGEG